MLEQIVQWDQWIFQLINQQWSNSFFDAVLPVLRDKYFWIPVYIFFLAFMLINYKWKGAGAFLFVILTIVITDQMSSQFIKHAVERLRPCNDPEFKEQVRLLVDCGPGFSFTSSHATNHFGLSTVLAVLLGQRFSRLVPFILIFWAFAVSYAQVYVGVHYPIDIFTGGILGILIGLITGNAAKFFIKFEP